MKKTFEQAWKEVILKLEKRFGEGLDLQAVLFLIGLQELGMVIKNSKRSKS